MNRKLRPKKSFTRRYRKRLRGIQKNSRNKGETARRSKENTARSRK